MSEGLIYYAHYGFSHLGLRGSRTRKQFLSGWETRQLKSAGANVITRGPGGNSERRSIKVQAVPIVTAADISASLSGLGSVGEVFNGLCGPELFFTRIPGNSLYSARAPPARMTQHFSTTDTIELSSYPNLPFFFSPFFSSAVKARSR